MTSKLEKFSWPLASCFALLLTPHLAAQAHPDVNQIIAKSVAANQANFKAADHFNWKERDLASDGYKTYQATMIYGTPYNRLIAEKGKPLPPKRDQEEMQKQKQEVEKRRAESPQARRERIDKYEEGRKHDNNMMNELTKAFNFKIVGSSKVRGFQVWVLKATPRPGYKPPNMDAQVLPGMQGELWIDQKTYQWVHVHATVIHPVAIEGFLAQVERGTEFDLQNAPVPGGTWQPSHFSTKSTAKVLFVFGHNSQEDDTYWDYKPADVNAGS